MAFSSHASFAWGLDNERALSTTQFWSASKKVPLSDDQRQLLKSALEPSLVRSMSQSTEIFEKQRLEQDDEISVGPNCFWFALAWHIPALRKTPRPVDFMTEATWISTADNVVVDLSGYQAPNFHFSSNVYYGIEDSLHLNPKFLTTHFDVVETKHQRPGDIFFISVEEKGFNVFPTDYEFYLEKFFEVLPYKFYTEAKYWTHAALYLGDDMVFQKDSIITDAFTLMKREDALALWQEEYSRSRTYRDDLIEVSNYSVKVLRPKPAFVEYLAGTLR